MKDREISYKIFRVCNFLIMVIIALMMLLPYLHVLAKSLNESTDTMMGGITFYPRKLDFTNYLVLLKDSSMIRAAGISISRVILGLCICLGVQFSGAYALSRDLPGKKKLTVFLIIPMFFSAGIIPVYILYVNMGLINNYLVYILPMAFGYYNVMVIRSYIESSVPGSLCEAAYLDGAGELTTMVKVVIPLCKPVIATVSLWIAVNLWNDWTTTLYYVTNEKLFTLQYKLMQLIKESERLQSLLRESAVTGRGAEVAAAAQATPESLVSAQVVITTIPIIAVYPFVQKYFVQGITLGAVKQ